MRRSPHAEPSVDRDTSVRARQYGIEVELRNGRQVLSEPGEAMETAIYRSIQSKPGL